MRPSIRRDAIVEIVEREKQITVEGLAAKLDASRETIRRDLTSLDAEGLIQKYHGGARVRPLMERAAIGEGRFRTRLSENRDAKRAIARAAVNLFANGDTLFIDTGSTTVLFAEELARLSDLTVITNSTAIAESLTRAEQRHRVYLIGGEFGRAGVFQVAPLETIDRIVTDVQLPAKLGEALDSANVEAIVVSTIDGVNGGQPRGAR
ncbi:DeoR/GlpR family DNA-binding transcription regulator [Bosea sp. 2YAB26]|uniref:DeoR/GlpR family DNA-binding transcription regulator n=1 Tax=Bosea sp. 2YAB26 TaxID=3237478 RepID=UPI003F929AB6